MSKNDELIKKNELLDAKDLLIEELDKKSIEDENTKITMTKSELDLKLRVNEKDFKEKKAVLVSKENEITRLKAIINIQEERIQKLLKEKNNKNA